MAVKEAAAVAGPNLTKLHPKLKTISRNLFRVAKALGFQVRITSGYRSYAQQNYLYRQYQAGLSNYPVNPPGTSKHEKGMALDILSTNTEALVSLLTSVGLAWGGPSDAIHFEIPSGQAAKSPRLNERPPGKAPVKAYPDNVKSAWAREYYDFLNRPPVFL